MCELLVLAFDTSNPDPELDKFAWKLGHVVDIKPDGWAWGTSEGLPKFWKVKIPGMAVETAQDYLKSLRDITNVDAPKEIGIRKWKFDYNTLSTPLKNTLNKDGFVSVTAAQVAAYMARISG